MCKGRSLGSLVSRGRFRRQGTQAYSARMSTPTQPYVDQTMLRLAVLQGFDPSRLQPCYYDPEQLWEQLELFGEPVVFQPDQQCLQKAINAAYALLARPHDAPFLRVLNDGEMVDALKLETSAGIGLIGGKGRNIAEGLRREGMVRAHLKAPNPCLAYARTSLGGRTRLVWGYPLEMTMMEARFARVLIDYFLRNESPMAFGLSGYAKGTKIECNIKGHGTVYSLDFSKFDAHVPPKLINAAFDCLGTWFSPEDREQFGWNTIRHYFVSTPIVMPDENLYVGKRKGVPSGSFFTQLVDSYVNLVLIFYGALRQGLVIPGDRVLVLGDDSIFAVRGNLDLAVFAKDMADLGMVLHPEKCGVNTLHFLGYTWYKGRATEPIVRTFTKLCCPEASRYRGLKKRINDPKARADLNLQVLNSACANSYHFALKYGPKNVMAMFVSAATPSDISLLAGTEKQRALSGFSCPRGRNFALRRLLN